MEIEQRIIFVRVVFIDQLTRILRAGHSDNNELKNHSTDAKLKVKE